MATIHGVFPCALALLAIASSAEAQGSSSSAIGGMAQAQPYADASPPVQASVGGTPTNTTVVAPASDYALAPPMPQHTHPGLKMGGHVGFGTIIGTAGTGPNTLIGRDTGVSGLVAGINFAFNAHWSIDLEFIVNAEWMNTAAGKANTFSVLDPGVKYSWGPVWVGLRAAVRLPSPFGAEMGAIPIVGVRTNNRGPVHYYIEADFPLFGGSQTSFTFVAYIQTGIAF